MRVHLVGCGKLGLPVALALEAAGHQLTGWDASDDRRQQIEDRHVPEASFEPEVADLLSTSQLQLVDRVPTDTEIVLVAVQTPHKPEFEGCVPLGDREPEDFDYTALKQAVTKVAIDCHSQDLDPLIVVISTCLPGTWDRELRPILHEATRTEGQAFFGADGYEERIYTVALRPLRFAYHPLFIAMGSVIKDFRNPEFILVGTDDQEVPDELQRLYAPLYHLGKQPHRETVVPYRPMSIASAELTKVAYNAWLGYKLMLANGLAELSDKVGANVDDILGTLKLATDRLVSTRYMDAGMGDGGGCHPRDQIALSHIARREGLSHDAFEVVIRQREAHAKWLADVWCDEADRAGLPMVLLGREYKPNTPLTTGSAARLVEHYARARGREPLVDAEYAAGSGPACYFLGAPHSRTIGYQNVFSGIMVDPWGLVEDRDDLEVIRPGRRA